MKNIAQKRRHTIQRRKNMSRPTRLGLTPEDVAWLNMPPIGREFGSREVEAEMYKAPDKILVNHIHPTSSEEKDHEAR